MKTSIKCIAIVALMFITSTSTAKEPILYVVADEDSKSLIFELDTKSMETAISFKDNYGNIIYSENIFNKMVYSKKFDLKTLEIGSYFLKVEDALRKTIYTIRVEKEGLFIEDRKESTKPFFRKNGGMVYLNFLNPDKKKVAITVYDINNRILFEETIMDEMFVEKIFNFKSAFPDSYTIVVKDNNDVYSEHIIVE